MHPRFFAQSNPDKPAVIMKPGGETVSFAELEARANQGAHLLRKHGVKNGDTIAIWLTNTPRYFELYWAGQRAGVFIVPLAVHLSPEEAAYIINDSGAKVLIATKEVRGAQALCDDLDTLTPGIKHIFTTLDPLDGAASWDAQLKNMPETPIEDEQSGFHLIYSSGTTGRPKGIKIPLVGGNVTAPSPLVERNRKRYGATQESVFLCPAPLYHTAPLLFSILAHRMGSTVVILKKFTPEDTLSAIETYGVTYAQMVPTMFVRLLRLPQEARETYDLSTLTHVIHSAAPCPPKIKRQMMEWFGEIIHEYYAASEANGSTAITPQEWLERPGSVGKADRGVVHICSDAGDELTVGEKGLIYFEGASNFEYLNDPRKTKDARHPNHDDWTTAGDIGYVDDDQYLYLSDRKSFVIISGGVNIYPQESESLLIQHPKVADAAVIGVPNEEMGEEVKAVVQPLDWNDANDAFAQELIDYCRKTLSHVKCPRSVDFDPALPRQENGKLYKRAVRDKYWKDIPN